jgi:hypothetical protein
MTQASADRENRSQLPTVRSEIPVFKPVALPALAAAMHAARQQPRQPKIQELPAILRKEAMLD